jgi:mono/diheme cytochrome c family protein
MAVAALLCGIAGRAEPQAARTVWDGVYTAEQAKRGAGPYKTHCASCHAENMLGAGGSPAAAGPEFLFNWKGKTAGDLFDYLKKTMPPDQSGGLSDQRYADMMAAMFQASEFPASEQTELPANADKLADILITEKKP